ncbi:SMI1/KNR4 family protein [Bacillus sp. CECT 9360]|uniref:SMI1/KNR4 family protein n=1 Tax=Bacillus sp. CECT 9360 TaxID=2845821 RepID=UPI001E511C22|nr:SMI1/KNR4 family protein [Bacillus sp. CECT 9360]CAH0344623.1 hypothetical protein BCI9360_00883 [Bacillus sp. CECT 9360]
MQDLLDLIQSSKPGVTSDAICETEKQLGTSFPIQYRELVMLTNKPEIGEWIFYPIKDPKNLKKTFDDIVRANHKQVYSNEYDYIIIGEDGSGNHLCFKNQDKQMMEPIYIWEHESGDTRLIAKNLRNFIITENK